MCIFQMIKGCVLLCIYIKEKGMYYNIPFFIIVYLLLFFKIRCAQSANTTTAPAKIHTSLMTSRPAPVSSGNPCSPLPKSGTQTSGVVTRKDSVPNVMIMTSPEPTKPTFGNQIPNNVKIPNDMIAIPKPCENV